MAKKTGPPPEYADEPINDEDFIKGAIELGQRLSRHLTALEDGEPGAVSDVAAVLRTLVVRGEGNDVIRKLCKRTHVPLPQVFVSRAAHAGPSVVMSAGGIPATPDSPEKLRGIDCLMADLNKWSAMTALVVRQAKRPVSDWNRVINMYAITFGSHMSGTIPKALVETSSIMSGDLDVGQYLIFCAGIVAESMLNQVLDTVSAASIIVPHRQSRKPRGLVHFTLKDPDRNIGDPAVEVGLQVANLPNVGDRADLLKLHIEGRYLRYWYTREANGQIYAKVDHATEQPDWWD